VSVHCRVIGEQVAPQTDAGVQLYPAPVTGPQMSSSAPSRALDK